MSVTGHERDTILGVYKLVDEDGDRRFAWRTTQGRAISYAALNNPAPGDRLVGPTGQTLHTY